MRNPQPFQQSFSFLEDIIRDGNSSFHTGSMTDLAKFVEARILAKAVLPPPVGQTGHATERQVANLVVNSIHPLVLVSRFPYAAILANPGVLNTPIDPQSIPNSIWAQKDRLILYCFASVGLPQPGYPPVCHVRPARML